MILKRTLFAWLVADGDMHLKNIALLKIAAPGESQFGSVRMAPLYDAVTTRVFPNLKHDRMALKLNGKDDNLRRADFRVFAATAGIRAGDADTAIDDMLRRMGAAVDGIALPKTINHGKASEELFNDVLDTCRKRMETFA
jgi:serine/threonine-protein kinase HipA